MTLAQILDDETVLQLICEQLDISYEDIKDKLPKNEEQETMTAQKVLSGVVVDERQTEGNLTSTT